jgi:hypothetical protein
LLIPGFVVTGWSDYKTQWQVGAKGGKVCPFFSILARWIYKFPYYTSPAGFHLQSLEPGALTLSLTSPRGD